MNKLLASAAIVGLMLAPSTTVLAQDAGQAQTQGETQASGELGQPSIGELPGLIAGNTEAATRLESMQSIEQSNISFVQLDAGAELDSAVQQNQAGIDTLHTSLEENSALWTSINDAYKANKGAEAVLSVDDVVAVGVEDDGKMVVYHRS